MQSLKHLMENFCVPLLLETSQQRTGFVAASNLIGTAQLHGHSGSAC